jgi:hypothetical protein
LNSFLSCLALNNNNTTSSLGQRWARLDQKFCGGFRTKHSPPQNIPHPLADLSGDQKKPLKVLFPPLRGESPFSPVFI